MIVNEDHKRREGDGDPTPCSQGLAQSLEKDCLLESPSAHLRDEVWKEMTYYITKDLPGF